MNRTKKTDWKNCPHCLNTMEKYALTCGQGWHIFKCKCGYQDYVNDYDIDVIDNAKTSEEVHEIVNDNDVIISIKTIFAKEVKVRSSILEEHVMSVTGCSKSTFDRAKKSLGIKSIKEGRHWMSLIPR